MQQVVDTAVNAHFALLGNKTPNVHVAQEYDVAQYLCVCPGMMRLLMKHWVEKNARKVQGLNKISNIFQICNVIQI